jgi:hypothetical protein
VNGVRTSARSAAVRTPYSTPSYNSGQGPTRPAPSWRRAKSADGCRSSTRPASATARAPATGSYAPTPTGVPGLVQPTTTPLLDVAPILNGLHLRTEQAVLFHTRSPITRARLCVAAAGTDDVNLRHQLAHTPRGAVDRIRQAPLHADAPGLAILAGLDTPLRGDLQPIRTARVALSDAPLPGRILVSVPVRRLPGAPATPGAEPRVVPSASILAPAHAHGAPLVAHGRLPSNAVNAAISTSVVSTRPGLTATAAAWARPQTPEPPPAIPHAPHQQRTHVTTRPDRPEQNPRRHRRTRG